MDGSVVFPTTEQITAMGDADLEHFIVELEHARRTWEATMVDVLDVADQRRVWATDGHRGVRNWMIALTGISPAEASRRCQVMRALRDLDHLRTSLRAGEIGVCQARELARIHANPRVRSRLRGSEQRMINAARRRCFDDFHTATTRWVAAADRTGAARTHDDVHAARRARVRVTPAGVTIDGHGGTTQGAQMLEIFAAYVDAEFRTEWETGRQLHGDAMNSNLLERTASQREFDALHAIFLAATRQPSDGAEPTISVPTVNIIIDQDTFEEHLTHAAGGPPPPNSPQPPAGGGTRSSSGPPAGANTPAGGNPPQPGDPTGPPTDRRCDTDHGIPIDPRDAVTAALIGRIRRVVYDSAGVVIDLGRTQRLFRGSAREAVWLQGRQCLWPGCGVTAHEQDHTDEWVEHHGTTDPRNGGPGCGRHNKWKHHGYRTWRDPDGVWVVARPDGTLVTEPRAA